MSNFTLTIADQEIQDFEINDISIQYNITDVRDTFKPKNQLFKTNTSL